MLVVLPVVRRIPVDLVVVAAAFNPVVGFVLVVVVVFWTVMLLALGVVFGSSFLLSFNFAKAF